MRHAVPADRANRTPTPLTSRQHKIVQVIEDSIRVNGYAPSLREIGDAVGLASTSSVAYQLSVLAEKGCLTREAGRGRPCSMRPPGRLWSGSRSSGGSGRAPRFSRPSRWKTSSRCPGNWSEKEISSCSGSSATR